MNTTNEATVSPAIYNSDTDCHTEGLDLELIEKAKQHLMSVMGVRGVEINGPKTAMRALFQLELVHREREVFGVLMLDNRHRVIEYRELFQGTINSASVNPREVVKAALYANAASVVITHNHPSGVAEPSASDEAITKRLIDALSLIDVRVLDHIIVGGDSDMATVSFVERGLI